MPHSPFQFFVGAAVVVATLLVRALTVNRLIRSKLRLTLILGGIYTLVAAAFAWASPLTNAVERLRSAEQLGPAFAVLNLLLALAVINFLVIVLINPWRVDRVPERFPNIVQDALVIGVFLLVGTLGLQEKFWTVSAVGGVVVGLALQDTLGNMFAGLAIQIEKPFKVGHWVKVGAFEGRVDGITWRATKLVTKTGNVAILPNNVVAKEAITNYSEPAAPMMTWVEVAVSYDATPVEVAAAVDDALDGVPGVLPEPVPHAVLMEFGGSSIVYRVRFWIDDFGADERIRDRARTALYYALRRHRIQIPYPIQVQYRHETPPAERPSLDGAELTRLIAGVDLFVSLEPGEREELAISSRDLVYGPGQRIVRQDAAGSSMFVIASGEVRVLVEPSGQEVAKLGPGRYFGEMSLLTGDPRSATVRALSECTLLEITSDTLRALIEAHPDVLEKVSAAAESRRVGLEKTRQQVVTTVAGEGPRSFLARVQQFLRLAAQ